MATALDYKYVYVNYVVASGDTDCNANKSETTLTNGADLPTFGQFIEIPPEHHGHANDLHDLNRPYDETTLAVQYITQNDQIAVMMMNADENNDDDDDTAIETASQQEDQLQRLTDELLIDREHEHEHEIRDTSGRASSVHEDRSDRDDDDEEDGEDDDDDSEHDLTNLAWLSEPNRFIPVNYLAEEAASDDPVECDREKPTKTNRPKVAATPAAEAEPVDPKEQLVRDKNLTQERFNKFMVQVQECQQAYASKEIAYRDNAAEKPPFIYAQMIAMAMVECGRMTLKDIEQWIQERFAYYRCTGNWNNSIRHNLSIHFGFTKIARDKNEKGKGGYWELSMNITKGEKKRVRNRSKRALKNGQANGVVSVSKRPRRMATGCRGVKSAVAASNDRVRPDGAKVATEMEELDSAVTSIRTDVTPVVSDGYETTCSDGTTSNGYDPDVYCTTSSLMHDGANEIFLGCDIPLSGDCIIIPYTGQSITTTSSSLAAAPLLVPAASISTTSSRTSTSSAPSTSPHSFTTGIDSTPASPSFAAVNGVPADYNNTYLASQLTAHATLIAHGLTNPTFGPNVIVETLPYATTTATAAAAQHQAVLDQVVDIERQFSSMVQLPEPELMAEYDAYFDYTGCSW